MKTANLTRQALETMTDAQRQGLIGLLIADNIEKVTVLKGGLELPDGYLEVMVSSRHGGGWLGGMDPEGQVST